MKKIIQGILVVAIVVLGYLLYESISKPINFKKEKNKRYEATIERLKDIRKAELAYKSEYGSFTGGFDTLVNFLREDSFKIVKAIGRVPDGMTESQALTRGIVSRDTVKVSVKDSLFKKIKYPIENIKYVPYTDKEAFKLGAGKVKTASGVKVEVFEAKVPNDVLLKGLDRQLVINLNDEARKMNNYPGLKVGDLDQPTNNAGNWE